MDLISFVYCGTTGVFAPGNFGVGVGIWAGATRFCCDAIIGGRVPDGDIGRVGPKCCTGAVVFAGLESRISVVAFFCDCGACNTTLLCGAFMDGGNLVDSKCSVCLRGLTNIYSPNNPMIIATISEM